jgi:hypothetical protein
MNDRSDTFVAIVYFSCKSPLDCRKLCVRCRSALRHCATSRKVAGSILDVVIGIFHRHNPCGHIMALGSTQPLTGIFPGG